jgi:hypothetical protein
METTTNIFNHSNWQRCRKLLNAKGYEREEIKVYKKAFLFFALNPNEFDGASYSKDLCDIKGLDLDAMLHDYHYSNCNANSNFATKWKADWMFAKGMERKGKSQYSSFGRFVGLTIVGLFIVPFNWKKANKEEIEKDYKILIKIEI